MYRFAQMVRGGKCRYRNKHTSSLILSPVNYLRRKEQRTPSSIIRRFSGLSSETLTARRRT